MMTEDDLEIVMKSSLSVEVDRCHLVVFYEYMCFLEYRYIGDNNDWFSSISDIEDYTGLKRKQVSNYIKCLEELGLLRVVRNKYSKETGKRTEVNHYKILGSTMNHGDEEEERTQAAEKPRGKKLKQQPAQGNKAIETKVEPKKDSHTNPKPPKTDDKAIESQPEAKNETPTPHIVNSGVDDDRASKSIFILYKFGMDENDWLRALGSGSRRQVNKCRAKYMAYLSQSDREYLDDYLDNLFKAA